MTKANSSVVAKTMCKEPPKSQGVRLKVESMKGSQIKCLLVTSFRGNYC